MKSARRYTLEEIDAMRASLYAIDHANGFNPYYYNSFVSVERVEAQYSAQRTRVEDQLRTYMVGGVGPSELKAKAEAAKVEQKKRAEEEAKAIAELRFQQEYGPRA